ncbi:hypothetical protein PsorP6_015944 [Peronosclerospora sorghi]|uniref:Uncharacterized protein n=1 Tax=Peronosclerospora sorghi TaxID=230839 RepID=A0ACC0WNB8_9STRA|nr:hypothetical protein PsorP6_015944 [Peronosclerospora sorghi]
MLRRVGVLCARLFETTRTMATNARATPVLRPIHFEIEPDEKGDRPFRIVGARDVEVQDWEYPTRIESEQKTRSRVVRNRFGYPNFLSLYVDKLEHVEKYLQQENVPYTSDGIVKGPDGHDVMVIEPSADGSSLACFNLCDNPAMVELVQAPPELIQAFEDDQRVD